jgi:hypothetical protein
MDWMEYYVKIQSKPCMTHVHSKIFLCDSPFLKLPPSAFPISLEAYGYEEGGGGLKKCLVWLIDKMGVWIPAI